MEHINEENKKYFKHCLYYKGEEECPFERFSTQARFWGFEQMFVLSVARPDSFKEMALDYIKTHKGEKNFMTSDAPIEQKAIVMYIEEMLRKWCPLGVDFVFEYGKV